MISPNGWKGNALSSALDGEGVDFEMGSFDVLDWKEFSTGQILELSIFPIIFPNGKFNG